MICFMERLLLDVDKPLVAWFNPSHSYSLTQTEFRSIFCWPSVMSPGLFMMLSTGVYPGQHHIYYNRCAKHRMNGASHLQTRKSPPFIRKITILWIQLHLNQAHFPPFLITHSWRRWANQDLVQKWDVALNAGQPRWDETEVESFYYLRKLRKRKEKKVVLLGCIWCAQTYVHLNRSFNVVTRRLKNIDAAKKASFRGFCFRVRLVLQLTRWWSVVLRPHFVELSRHPSLLTTCHHHIWVLSDSRPDWSTSVWCCQMLFNWPRPPGLKNKTKKPSFLQTFLGWRKSSVINVMLNTKCRSSQVKVIFICVLFWHWLWNMNAVYSCIGSYFLFRPEIFLLSWNWLLFLIWWLEKVLFFFPMVVVWQCNYVIYNYILAFYVYIY